METAFVSAGLVELALFTTTKQLCAASHTPLPMVPVPTWRTTEPDPVGSGCRIAAWAKLQPAELAVEISTVEHSRMLTTLPAV